MTWCSGCSDNNKLGAEVAPRGKTTDRRKCQFTDREEFHQYSNEGTGGRSSHNVDLKQKSLVWTALSGSVNSPNRSRTSRGSTHSLAQPTVQTEEG